MRQHAQHERSRAAQAGAETARRLALMAASLVCEGCELCGPPRKLQGWGWVHGKPGIGVRPCVAWRIHAALAGGRHRRRPRANAEHETGGRE